MKLNNNNNKKEEFNMANATNEVMNRAEGASHEFKKVIGGTENNLEKISHDAGKKVGAMASDFVASTSEYARTGRDYVKENPAKGVALAAAVGVVAGSLLTIALRRRH